MFKLYIQRDVIDSLKCDTRFVVERKKCDCSQDERPCCLQCLGTGKWNHWHLVEIDKPQRETSTEGDENDENDRSDLSSWDSPGRVPNPERLLLAKERRARIDQALKKLPAHYAMVIRKRYWEDETQEEVAQQIGVDQSTVSNYEEMGRLSLKFVFGDNPRERHPSWKSYRSPAGGWLDPPVYEPTLKKRIIKSNGQWLVPEAERPCTDAENGFLIGIKRYGVGGTCGGGQWPTREWKLANREEWSRTGTCWKPREIQGRPEVRGTFVAEEIAGLARDSEEPRGDDNFGEIQKENNDPPPEGARLFHPGGS
jgi:RNA polymerase sigma factor (sigma-70 family)